MEQLVISSTSLKTWKDCRKAYELGYERLLDPVYEKKVVEDGIAFHEYMEAAAKATDESTIFVNPEDEMGRVAEAYLKHNPLPVLDILGAEKPLFTRMGEYKGFEVWLRCTFDLIYKSGEEHVFRDYKTFDKRPSPDLLDLDFQGRLYSAVGMKHFKTNRAHFEYEYVRRTPPNIPKDKAGNVWEPDECYFHYPLVISEREATEILNETWQICQEIVDTKENKRYYRQDKKGFMGCEGCFYKNLCLAEFQLGELDQQTIEMFAKPREPLKVIE